LFLLSIGVCALPAATVVAPARPNILFAIADDWGPHASAYGTPWIKTPAFDRVASAGVLFKNAFTPNAKCAPSRACILTGRNSWELKEAANHICYFPPEFKGWGEALAQNGWNVGYTSKGWGPGVANDSSGNPRKMTGVPYNRRKANPPTKEISENDYAANFADFLNETPPDKPWCFWYGSIEPHRGYEFGSGIRLGGKKLTDIKHVPAYWPDTETLNWMRDQGMRSYEMTEIHHRGLGPVLDESFATLTNQCDGVFLSVDIDVVDPGMAPGTGTPEPGGMTSRELLEAVRRICLELPVVGIDVVEVAPAFDSADITAILANRVVLEALSAIAKRRNGTPYSPTQNLLDR
jgi:hypothetical protein